MKPPGERCGRRRSHTLRQKDRRRTELWRDDFAPKKQGRTANLSGKRTECTPACLQGCTLFLGGHGHANVPFLLELAGTVAFAVSGAVLGIEKHMDIFGVGLLGITTAVGGGILRDLVVGLTPPRAFQDPMYLLVALGVSVVLFFPFVRRLIGRSKRVFDALMLLMDATGLGIFTITGINTAITLAGCADPLLLVFVGLLTGTGGGVLRDVLAGDMPYILRKHIYASASIAGGILYLLLRQVWHGPGAILTGVLVVVGIRCAAAHFEWNLPRAKTVWKSGE